MQLKLLQQALAPWPRRSAPLLEVNCGQGDFLPFLWQWGFDVVATEFDSKLRKAAFASMSPAPEICSAKEDDLPFEDDFFDWVIVHLSGGNEDPKASIREALRVGRRGLMLTFWNKHSLPALLGGGGHKSQMPDAVFSWRQIWSCARSLRAGRLSGMTTLCAPVFTWGWHCFFSRANSWHSTLPIGAWAIIRIDLATTGTATPLGMRLEKAMTRPEPAMEYVNKTAANKVGKQ